MGMALILISIAEAGRIKNLRIPECRGLAFLGVGSCSALARVHHGEWGLAALLV